jgi:hypothetical protein
MNVNFFCEDAGSILITGREGQMQGIVGRQIVTKHLMSGGALAVLVDSIGDGRGEIAQITDMLRALGAESSAVDNVVILENISNYREANVIQFSVEKRLQHLKTKPLLIYRNLASAMHEFSPADPWNPMAEELAVLLDCRVLTVAHWGRPGFLVPDYSAYAADEIWTCEAGLNLAVKMQRRIPSNATLQLAGQMLAGNVIAFQLAFENAEPVEVANVQ